MEWWRCFTIRNKEKYFKLLDGWKQHSLWSGQESLMPHIVILGLELTQYIHIISILKNIWWVVEIIQNKLVNLSKEAGALVTLVDIEIKVMGSFLYPRLWQPSPGPKCRNIQYFTPNSNFWSQIFPSALNAHSWLMPQNCISCIGIMVKNHIW